MSKHNVLLIPPTIQPNGVAYFEENANVFYAPDGQEDTLIRCMNEHQIEAVALRCELDPCTEPAMLGVTITNGLVYYGRSIAFIILELYLLWCIAQERDVLSGRGYAIAPAPVRLSGRTVLGLVLAVTVAATIPALWLSSRCFVGPAEPLPELSAQQQAAAHDVQHLRH